MRAGWHLPSVLPRMFARCGLVPLNRGPDLSDALMKKVQRCLSVTLAAWATREPAAEA